MATNVKFNDNTVLQEVSSRTEEGRGGKTITTKVYDVVVNGKRVGYVSSHYELGYRKTAGSRLVTPTTYRLTWSGTPLQAEGKPFRRSGWGYTSRKGAVEYVLGF